MEIRSIAVFCGSQDGKHPLYAEHASELGRMLAGLNIKLVYGGGNKGLMGKLADAVMVTGGTVMGVIPQVLLEWEQQHKGITELIVVPDMHTRKKMMYELCDAAIILPGGFGTMDEFFEMLTWNQLKIHDKPIYILNTIGFYAPLLQHLKTMEREGFLYGPVEDRIHFCENPGMLINKVLAR